MIVALSGHTKLFFQPVYLQHSSCSQVCSVKVLHSVEPHVRGGPTLTCLVDEGRDDPATTKSRPLSAHRRNAIFYGISLAGRSWPNIECWLGSFVIFQGAEIRTRIAKKPYIFVIFQEGSGPPAPFWIRMEPGLMALSGAY